MSTGDLLDPNNAHILNYIMLNRIYDVLITILRTENEELALQVLEAHMKGKIMGPAPYWDGSFMTFDDSKAPEVTPSKDNEQNVPE